MKKIDLMIIGAQKAATTSLKNYLGEHPQISTHEHIEFDFFVDETKYQQGYDKIFKLYFPSYNNQVIVAKHIKIMYDFSAIKRLYEHNPDIKLVIILRNPIDRAYSAWLYEKRIGKDQNSTFEDAVNLDQIFEGNYYNIYIEYSLYYKYISKLLKSKIFKTKQIKIFLYENLKKNPVSICQEIFSWLGLKKEFVPNIKKIHNQAAVSRFLFITNLIYKDNYAKRLVKMILPHRVRFKISQIILKLNEKPIAPPQMNENTREILKEFFKTPNKQLSDLLELDLSLWDE